MTERQLINGVGRVLAGLYLLFAVAAGAQTFAPRVNLSSLGSSQAGARIDGANAGDLIGQAVTSLDFNGDGLDDLVIASQGFDLLGSQGNVLAGNSGAVYVLYGAPGRDLDGFDLALLQPENGGDGSQGFVLRGNQTGEQVGNALADAGDVNNDGISDLLIGAANFIGSFNNGGAYLIFGRPQTDPMPALFDLSNLRTADGTNSGFGVLLQGSQGQGGAGTDVAGVGDVNADGLDDIVIGNSYFGVAGVPRSGFTFVVYGRDGTASWPDFINMVSLQSNVTTGADGFTVISDVPQNALGSVTTALDDFDGDGLADFFLGSPAASSSTGPLNSGGFIIPGRPSGPGVGFDVALDLRLEAGRATAHRLLGDGNDDNTGVAAANIGDVNGDGRPDLAVAANLADQNGEDSGTVYVLFGRSANAPLPQNFDLTTLLPTGGGNGSAGFAVVGDAGQQLGDALTTLGDFNGDGLDDFLIGARFDDLAGSDAGAGYVVFGRSQFPAQITTGDLRNSNGSQGFVLAGETGGDQAGSVVGVTRQDNAPHLVIASRLSDKGGSNAGRVYLMEGVAGASQALTGRATRAWYDPARAGEGVLTEVGTLNGQPVLFVTWYTYLDGRQFWLAGGPVPFTPGASEVTLDLVQTSGADFGQEFMAADVASTVWGSLTLTLDACDRLGWRYLSQDGQVAGQLNFVPLLADQLGLDGCVAAKGSALDRSFAGTWWNPQRAGEGIVIDVELRGGTPTAFFSWFTYLDQQQVWLVGSAPITGSALVDVPLVVTSGTGFGAQFSPGEVVVEDWGTATLRFDGCNAADLDYSGAFGTAPAVSGNIVLERFTNGQYLVPCSP